MHQFFVLLALSPLVRSARGRITLDRARHAVVLHDHTNANPTIASQINSVPVLFAGQNSRTLYCKLPFGRSVGGLRRVARDADRSDASEVNEARTEKRKLALAHARWAPLRHRCQAWRWKNNSYGSSQWSYRWCFNSEATMWSSLPWLERQCIGWHDELRDEAHVNGSVTLHYANGTGGRSAIVRCDCGYGGPNITSFEIDKGELRHTLKLTMASCCNFRWENSTRWPLFKTFQWLTSPLDNLACFLFRRESIEITFCPSNNTLIRTLASSRSSTTKKTRHDKAVVDASLSVHDHPIEVISEKLPTEDIETDTITETTRSERDLEQSEETAGGAAQKQSYRTNVTLGSGIVSVRLVLAKQTMTTYSSDDAGENIFHNFDGSFSATKGVALASSLDDALEVNNLGQHNAVEIELRPVGPCESTGSRSKFSDDRLRRVLVRWICPSHWRSRAPQREDGHTALIAIEQPDRCTTVAWMSSLLLCAHDRLLPPSAEPLQINCYGQKTQAASDSHEQHFGKSTQSQEAEVLPTKTLDPEGLLHSLGVEKPASDRSGVKFCVGQVVHNRQDGTRGAIIAWRNQALNTNDKSQEVRYLVLLDRRHLPFGGAPTDGSARLPGRAVWVPQGSLQSWGGSRRTSPPLELPVGVIGHVFTGYDGVHGRFVPAEWLHRSFPADAQAALDVGAISVKRPGTMEQTLNDMSASFKALQVRLGNVAIPKDEVPNTVEEEMAESFATSNPSETSELMKNKLEQMQSKKAELQRKLDELRELKEKFNALTELTETLQSTETEGPDIDTDSTVTQLLEKAGMHEESSIGEEIRNALKDIGVDVAEEE